MLLYWRYHCSRKLFQGHIRRQERDKELAPVRSTSLMSDVSDYSEICLSKENTLVEEDKVEPLHPLIIIPIPKSRNESQNSTFNGTSKSLLLRLFQSELFTAVQALHYLQKYYNEPGIQYYLCERLKQFPEEDVNDLLPQLW